MCVCVYQWRNPRGCFVVEVLDDHVEERVAERFDRRGAVHRGLRLDASANQDCVSRVKLYLHAHPCETYVDEHFESFRERVFERPKVEREPLAQRAHALLVLVRFLQKHGLLSHARIDPAAL